MPEKIADKVETNGRPIPQKVEEPIRRFMFGAGYTMQDGIRITNELMATTTKFYVDMLGRGVRDTIDMANKSEHAMEEMLTIYRRSYTDGFKAWQTYFEDITKLIRPR